MQNSVHLLVRFMEQFQEEDLITTARSQNCCLDRVLGAYMSLILYKAEKFVCIIFIFSILDECS